jgi:hypothetical protein
MHGRPQSKAAIEDTSVRKNSCMSIAFTDQLHEHVSVAHFGFTPTPQTFALQLMQTREQIRTLVANILLIAPHTFDTTVVARTYATSQILGWAALIHVAH